MKFAYKYKPKKPFAISYMVLICIAFLLALGKWLPVLDESFVIINAEIHSHISNFILSMIAYLGIGYSWLLFGVKFRFIIILGAVLIAGNFACETIMGFMNTPDIIDAIYGTIGTAVSFIFLYITHMHGLIPIPSQDS